ncbi:hypothetical protein [Vitiosangium sp. GDMCC 1.1324]|uniref:hypothetical protein n=1 Tax=Vitiosangium sp. (strain GDMCC 1.1324) TaxID=2138576 RepID=UPI000D35B5C5|nr:hypothetical protein [Vitiosangium sp. GDMCC 1.1324]PTL75914.1 hypothetical protein DAT35_52490 [Vitiosangium sp. GDMCC 1.1324]
MNRNGHGPSARDSQFESSAQYLLFTSKVKHGHFLRYLLAIQARRRLLETYKLWRQVKSSALTGDPDQVFEVYYVEGSHRLSQDSQPFDALLELMSREDAVRYRAIQEAIDAEKQDMQEMMERDRPVIPHSRILFQMPYMTRLSSQESQGGEFTQEIATDPYLLNVICVLNHEGNSEGNTRDLESVVSEFDGYMTRLIPSFAQSGFSLLVGGRFKDHPDWLLNIWQFSNLEQHTDLMMKLADNELYGKLDELCLQEQHICRNVSRYQQHQPLLMLT